MALERVGSKALAIVKADQKNIVPPKAQKKVLDEDAYTEVLIYRKFTTGFCCWRFSNVYPMPHNTNVCVHVMVSDVPRT